jgi:hypothetical protein
MEKEINMENIDIDKLMIGNYVYDCDNYVDVIIGMNSKTSIIVLENYGEIHIKHIAPIPIVKEWLYDFGFVNNKEKYTGYFKHEISRHKLRKLYDNSYSINIYDRKSIEQYKDVKYIHELQNYYNIAIRKLKKL